MNAIAADNAIDSGNRNADIAAAQRILSNVKEYLELLTAGIGDLMRALDGPPGAVCELTSHLLDDRDLSWRFTPRMAASRGEPAASATPHDAGAVTAEQP